MNGCIRDSHSEEGKNLNTGIQGTGRTPPGGSSVPAGPVHEGPSPKFMKQYIEVLRTVMELDNKGKEKVIPRRLWCGGSWGAGPEESRESPSVEVKGYSSDGSRPCEAPFVLHPLVLSHISVANTCKCLNSLFSHVLRIPWEFKKHINRSVGTATVNLALASCEQCISPYPKYIFRPHT